MTDEVLRDTIKVPKIRGESYEFRIPSIHDEIKIGTRMRKLQKDLDPEWDGFSQGLDGGTLYNLRACATFELLLEKCSAKWPFTETKTGVAVLSANFPSDKVDDLLLAYQGFEAALRTFRERGLAQSKPAGGEAVESQPDTQ